MEYGICTFPTEYGIQPGDLARAVEERGFDSLWFAEHTHIPCSRKTPWPGGGELPKEYYYSYDLFVALTAAATATTRLRIGSGVCLVVEHDPISLAKAVATLDRISAGRFLFGVGGGWNVEEMANHGTDFRKRWKLLRERIEAMKAIWANEKAEYHGELVDFEPIYSWPKPVQQPHPPIYVGGAAPWALRRAVRYGNGWIPIGVRDEVLPYIPELKRLAAEAGRDPQELAVLVYLAPPDRETLERYREAGVQAAIFGVPAAPPEQVLPMLDDYRRLADEVG
ncbi:MAG: LLM class F420-dependent oxidoreductase [Candidatus Dadabacteria bacterium]|nr:MAG: LLM class F420-dependent oxidoreductase [Candidatus Dadabacteria bacterium]